MPEGIPGYLRIRVVNPRVSTLWSENFENPSNFTANNLWTSVGTDATGTLSYWTADVGSPTITSNVVTLPAAGKMHGGHKDWGDMEFLVRVTLNTGGHQAAMVHFTDTSNFIYADITTNLLSLRKVVAGTDTLVSSVSPTLTNGNVYWIDVLCNGTAYTVTLFNDSSGAKGSQVSPNGQISTASITDSVLQNGYVGAFAQTVSMVFGGAFTGVCKVTSNTSAPNFWNPIVTTGEPAFCLSKISPQAGTYSASIQLANSAGNGAWQQATTLAATQATTQTLVQGQIKASAGTATVSAGGLTTSSGTSAFANQTATGTMTASPTVSCNFSGAVGTAYYDSLSVALQGLEITNDLPHLHQSQIQVRAFQPGSPGSNALGSFTVRLHPPGSEGYAAAKPIYDQLDYFQRLEMYSSHDGASLGNLYYAGIVTEIRKSYGQNSSFELTGASDVVMANLSRHFSGELSFGDNLNGCQQQLQDMLAGNELGASDTFSPFTAANYTSTHLPGLTAGTWSSTTDDGLNVVTCSTGTGAALISKVGAAANDKYHMQFVEVSGRLDVSSSTSATNAGIVGVGLSSSNVNVNNGVVGQLRATDNAAGGRYGLDALLYVYSGGVLTQTTKTAVLTSVDDAQLFIPFTLQLLCQNDVSGEGSKGVVASLVINGSTVISQQATSFDPGTTTVYPLLAYEVPATGSAPCFLTNLVQMTRYSNNLHSDSVFTQGSTGTATVTLDQLIDPAPTFLDLWARAENRPGWYLRYNPKAYVVGTRTLGTVDFKADPGTDRGTNQSIFFSRATGNLIEVSQTGNSDQFVSGTLASGPAGNDGHGLSYWRDVGTMTKYGVIEDQMLTVVDPTYNTLRHSAQQSIANRINIKSSGSKMATILRDPQTVDVWRELDKVMIHDPDMGINYLVARVMSLTFTEGQVTQQLTLDQFSSDDPLLLTRRFQQGTFQIAASFSSR